MQERKFVETEARVFINGEIQNLIVEEVKQESVEVGRTHNSEHYDTCPPLCQNPNHELILLKHVVTIKCKKV